MRDLEALNHEMQAAGAWVFAAGLHPTEYRHGRAATGRRGCSSPTVLSLKTKEHLGGFTVIEAADLDAALGWAGKLARATTLPIEVRPIQH